MNPVVHFEMPAADMKRMVGFYEKVFGWKTQQLGEEMGRYVIATTTELEKSGFPKEPGRINGGFYPRNKGTWGYPSIVIAVDDIDEHMKKVTKAGGKVLGKPVDIPGIGMYVSFEDTENNRLSILQPKMKAN